MYEVFVLVDKKPSIVVRIAELFFLILAIVAFVITLLGGSAFIMFMLLGAFFAWFLHTRRYEFEYSFFDGDVRFAKIVNKSSRKKLPCYTMEQVLTIAPIEDRSLSNILRQDRVRVIDYTSGYPNRKVYGMVVKTDESTTLIQFEPDEKYLDAVCVKYRQKVVR